MKKPHDHFNSKSLTNSTLINEKSSYDVKTRNELSQPNKRNLPKTYSLHITEW